MAIIKNNTKKSQRCYIYTRVSTEIQIEGYSLDAQKERLTKEAKYRGMQVVETFSDEGKSGKNTSGRPAFKEMMKRIENSNEDKVDYVLVFKLSRFGRNTADVLGNLQLMQDFGVNLLAVEEGIDSAGPAGKLMISVIAAVAEIERENILEQTMAGRRQKAHDGKWNGGQAPYGYKLKDGVLQIDESEAEVVRLMFERYIKYDQGLSGVAKWLNNNGYKKPLRGNCKYELFSSHFVKTVLDNPVYIGKIAYGRRKTEKIEGTRNEFHKVKQSEGDYDLWEGQHEAIIDDYMWSQVREKRKRTAVKREKKHSLDHEHVLSGILKCPICGAPMYGAPGRKKRKDGTYYENSMNKFYYVCKHRRTVDGKQCTFGKYIDQSAVNAEVWDVIREALESGSMDATMRMVLNDRTDPKVLSERMESLRKERHKKVLAKDKRAAEIDQLDVTDPAYDAKYEDLQKRLDMLYMDIVQIDKDIEETENDIKQQVEKEATIEDAHAIVEFFLKHADKKMTSAQMRSFVQSFVKEVLIYPEEKRDGWVRQIEFFYPMTVNGELGLIFQHQETTDETVCLMSRKDK